MARVIGVNRVINALKRHERQLLREGSSASVIVGYTAKYALAVHENIEMKWQGLPRRSGKGVYWGPSGQAKFLEEPARRQAKQIASIVHRALEKRTTLLQALLLGGLFLQRESMKLCPVEFGNLRASAFTRKE
jgi:hypothetical protein